MRKVIKRILWILLCVALVFVAVRFGPSLYERLFGAGNAQWISERFSETLKEKNQLVVYEVETTGQETVSQDAWLIGTVQKVEMPYTFSLTFTVDLSLARVSATGNSIEVRVPGPVADYHKLTVDEAKMKKFDWLYPLTPERYSAIKEQVEERLVQEYANSDECLENAWGVTVKNLESLFQSVTERSDGGTAYEIRVLRDDSLAEPAAQDGEPDASAKPAV